MKTEVNKSKYTGSYAYIVYQELKISISILYIRIVFALGILAKMTLRRWVIVSHRVHFVLRLSVYVCVSLSSNAFLVVRYSYVLDCCHSGIFTMSYFTYFKGFSWTLMAEYSFCYDFFHDFKDVAISVKIKLSWKFPDKQYKEMCMNIAVLSNRCIKLFALKM